VVTTSTTNRVTHSEHLPDDGANTDATAGGEAEAVCRRAAMTVHRFQLPRGKRHLGVPVLVVREVGEPFFIVSTEALLALFDDEAVIYAECDVEDHGLQIKHLVEDPGWAVVHPFPLR
jgi:hypothetical protein